MDKRIAIVLAILFFLCFAYVIVDSVQDTQKMAEAQKKEATMPLVTPGITAGEQSIQVFDQFGSVTLFYEKGANCAVVLEDRYVFIKYADGRIVRIRGNITTIVKSKEEGK